MQLVQRSSHDSVSFGFSKVELAQLLGLESRVRYEGSFYPGGGLVIKSFQPLYIPKNVTLQEAVTDFARAEIRLIQCVSQFCVLHDLRVRMSHWKTEN